MNIHTLSHQESLIYMVWHTAEPDYWARVPIGKAPIHERYTAVRLIPLEFETRFFHLVHNTRAELVRCGLSQPFPNVREMWCWDGRRSDVTTVVTGIMEKGFEEMMRIADDLRDSYDHYLADWINPKPGSMEDKYLKAGLCFAGCSGSTDKAPGPTFFSDNYIWDWYLYSIRQRPPRTAEEDADPNEQKQTPTTFMPYEGLW